MSRAVVVVGLFAGTYRRLVFALLLVVAARALAVAPTGPTHGHIVSRGRSVAYDDWTAGSVPARGTIVLLHTANGASVMDYAAEAALFASHGYRTVLLHYYDATASHSPTDQNYAAWVNAVEDLVDELHRQTPNAKVYLVGYSLGASVALAAGSQRVPTDAIVEWAGSLPDVFFRQLKGMPPLLILHGRRDTNVPVHNAEQLIRLCGIAHFTCEHEIYPDQGHAFAGPALDDAQARTLAFLGAH